jgi:hypothetical protein
MRGREGPAHDEAGVGIFEQGHPGLARVVGLGQEDSHREFLVVGLPQLVTVAGLPLQVGGVPATSLRAITYRSPLDWAQVALYNTLKGAQRRDRLARRPLLAPCRSCAAPPGGVGVSVTLC